MCVIIDTNLINEFENKRTDLRFTHIWEWLQKKDGKLRYCQDMAKEYSRTRFKKTLIALKEAGKAIESDNALVLVEMKLVEGVCCSDDPCILALAKVSGARLLVTEDQDLKEDFGNHHIISNPRGKVYTHKNTNLLRHTSGCLNTIT